MIDFSKHRPHRQPQLRLAADGARDVNVPTDIVRATVHVDGSSLEEMRREIPTVLQNILVQYGKEPLLYALEAFVVEVATNAAKANIKHVFFKENGWDIGSTETHTHRMKTFASLSRYRDWWKEYEIKAAMRDLFVQAAFKHDKHGLGIEVTNNLPLSPIDEGRIRQKMEHASGCRDLVQYFCRHADNTEGEGLGLAYSILVLKDAGIDPAPFVVRSAPADHTTASLYVPFAA